MLLEKIAEGIEALGDELLERTHQETALPMARLQGERGRTCGQLRLFANVVREGAYLDVRHDPADANREPIPKPELKRYKIPIGPVAVFGASNFPLAFSAAKIAKASTAALASAIINPSRQENSFW